MSDDFDEFTRSRRQGSVIVTEENLQRCAIDLMRTELPPIKGVRLAGVAVSNFGEAPTADLAGGAELPISSDSAAA